ncbi:MAG: DUF3137 domain-containing protein [Flavobacteriales bacterium]
MKENGEDPSGEKEGAPGAKDREAFKAFKEKELRQPLEELEQFRDDHSKAQIRRFLKPSFLIWLTASLLGGVLVANFLHPGFLLLYVIFPYVAYIYLEGDERSPYRRKFRAKLNHELLKPTVRFIHPELEFHPNARPSSEKIDGSLLFPFGYNIRQGTGTVEGSFEGRWMEVSDLELIYEMRGQNMKNRNTIFRGFFLLTELSEDIGCTLVIRPRKFKGTEKKLPDGAIGKVLFYDPSKNLDDPDREGKLEAIELEDPSFDELFTVYGNDQVRARQVLTMSTIEWFKGFREEWGEAIFLSIQGSQLYLAIELPGGFIHTIQIDQGVGHDEARIEEFFQAINRAVKIPEELDRNLLRKEQQESEEGE